MTSLFIFSNFIPTFIASVFGSTHCIAMCGGFSCLAGSNNCAESKSKSLKNISLYNVGRLFSYLIIVILISVFDVSFKNLSLISSFSGALLILIILSQFFDLLGIRKVLNKVSVIKKVSNLYLKYYGISISKIAAGQNFWRSFLLGILTALIPCGWLYLNLGLASNQDSLFRSMLLVLAFWLGTLPALNLVGLGSTNITKKLSGPSKTLGYIVILVLSIFSLKSHFPEILCKTDTSKTHCYMQDKEGN